MKAIQQMPDERSPAFFFEDDGHYIPTRKAVSAWSPNQLGGTAVCALLAHELEKHSPGASYVPARFTADLFSPVLAEPVELHSSVVRDGNRIRVVDAQIIQQGEVRTRATTQFLTYSEEPPGQVWKSGHNYPLPEQRLDHPQGSLPLFKSGDGDWTHDFTSAVNAHRKSTWVNVPPLLHGHAITPFERAAFVADFTNLMGNWGTDGVGYINTDVTMTLSRLPIGHELGMQAQDHIAANGVAVSTTTIYDRSGALGTCIVSALSNSHRQVDVASAYEQTHALRTFSPQTGQSRPPTAPNKRPAHGR